MFKRRLKILLALIGLVFLVMLVRLGHLQLLRGDKYREAAALGLCSYEFPQGQRGRIFDRNGVILAEDVACHDLCLDYGFVSDEDWWTRKQVREICREKGWDRNEPKQRAYAEAELERRKGFTWQLVERVAQVRGQNARQMAEKTRRRVERWRDAAGTTVAQEYTAHPVATALSEEEVNSLRPLMKHAVGAALVPSRFRRYPQGAVACHIIGVTGPVYREDAQEWNWGAEAGYVERMRHNLLPGDRLGKTGVERMCEEHLQPHRGLRVYRRPGELSYQEPAVNGRDVHLTLDVELQAELRNLLGRTGCNGAIVILDVAGGDVLAAASWPGFDLNTYRAKYNDLAGLAKHPDPNNPQKTVFTKPALDAKANRPLLGRAFTGVYPPGSTIKPVTGIAGMGEKVITPYSPIECTGVNRHARNGKPRCWIYKMHPGVTHPPLDLFGGLKNSCNIYFVEVGHRLGPQRMTDWFCLFGFGQSPKMGLSPSEQSAGLLKQSGFLPSDAWFMAIGQGFAATPLQVAAAHATIARDGLYLSPRLSLENAPKQVQRQVPITPAQAQVVRRGMHAVVHDSRGGTAYKHWRDAGVDLDVEIGGKTGTAAAPPLKIDTDGDGKRDTLVVKGDHAWFAGFAPYQRPRVAFAVILEYAGGGGKNAGPVAKKALRICEKFGYLTK